MVQTLRDSIWDPCYHDAANQMEINSLVIRPSAYLCYIPRFCCILADFFKEQDKIRPSRVTSIKTALFIGNWSAMLMGKLLYYLQIKVNFAEITSTSPLERKQRLKGRLVEGRGAPYERCRRSCERKKTKRRMRRTLIPCFHFRTIPTC